MALKPGICIEVCNYFLRLNAAVLVVLVEYREEIFP